MWTRVGSTLRRFFSRESEGRSGESDPHSVPDVVAEASTFLGGRAADAYVCDGRTIPYWAWLNALAHRPPGAMRAVATAYPWGAITRKTIAIADLLDLVSPDQARAIQARVLVPAELAALAHGTSSPDDVVQCVQDQVAQICRRGIARR